jgi:hypothetical protein
MAPVHPNNLAQDLPRFHRTIAAGGGVASQNKGKPRTVSCLYVQYTMGNEAASKTTEDDVSYFELRRCHRLNRDHVPVANAGVHASSRGSETDSEAKAQQLGAKAAKMTKTRR